ARNCARRVVLLYFSNPVPASVSCERFFISTSCSRVVWRVASQHTTRKTGTVIQRFPRQKLMGAAVKPVSRVGGRSGALTNQGDDDHEEAPDSGIRDRGGVGGACLGSDPDGGGGSACGEPARPLRDRHQPEPPGHQSTDGRGAEAN